MATRTIEVRTCDVCGSDNGVEQYQVSGSLGSSTVDLCTRHAAPLVEVMTAGKLRRRPGRRRAGAPGAAKKVATTKVAAECLGWQDRIGTLEVGKLADVVITRTDPLADIRSLENTNNIAVVLKGGAVMKDLR